MFVKVVSVHVRVVHVYVHAHVCMNVFIGT
jgi:hypothetical protein